MTDLIVVRQLLEAPLSDVVDPEIATRPDGVVESWTVPAPGRETLIRHGLPSLPEKLFQPRLQRTSVPEVEYDGDLYYRIGDLGRSGVVGALDDSSEVHVVFAQRRRRQVLNSTLAGFVDAIWRWSKVVQLVEGNLDDFELVEDSLELFVASQRAADPVASSRADWAWADLVEGF